MQPSATRIWLLWLLIGPAWALRDNCPALPHGKPQLYSFHIVAEFPHDPTGFTQGAQGEGGDSRRPRRWSASAVPLRACPPQCATLPLQSLPADSAARHRF
jgi:hypothetical protein